MMNKKNLDEMLTTKEISLDEYFERMSILEVLEEC